MSKLHRPALILAMSLIAAACSSSTTSQIVTSTSETLPVTTLPPTAGQAPTTSGPSATSTTSTTVPPATNECVVAADTSVEGYAASCTVLGITIRASDEVDEAAVVAQAERVFEMLVTRPDLVTSLAESGIEGRVIPEGTRITSLPEFSDLYDLYPGTDWNRRGRSFPGTQEVPFFAGAEENLLCLEDDFYEGEDIFVRTLALTIRRFALEPADPATDLAIDQAYGQAIAAERWVNTLAEINSDEYWMEGTQSWFDANLEDTAEDREPNSSHNEVDTRAELLDYDPTLAAIAASVFGDGTWRPSCP